ncbi:hypothetical protein COCMIDRAFT_26978 [Bipolaris oryzae ATCC 44560]|uniref:Uncharacterized protein n=1 Tax=Bipolaris oryzae ATCC 44560 TaxID=930090 RepID=W6YZH6_COCMI|nr:uncharacterized protein COCMIDRAFT_26978 [Bipolaris oryzae ATCC 44560]EUC44727.1 hypothetical protein COCMIDRAFT_26978 [Bipolaris oryzae ATCC 44560]
MTYDSLMVSQYICLDFVNAIISNRSVTPALPYVAVYAHAPGKLLRAVSVHVGCMDHFSFQSRNRADIVLLRAGPGCLSSTACWHQEASMSPLSANGFSEYLMHS